MCVYVCVCVCVCVYIYKYVCVCVSVSSCVYMCVECVYVCMCANCVGGDIVCTCGICQAGIGLDTHQYIRLGLGDVAVNALAQLNPRTHRVMVPGQYPVEDRPHHCRLSI